MTEKMYQNYIDNIMRIFIDDALESMYIDKIKQFDFKTDDEYLIEISRLELVQEVKQELIKRCSPWLDKEISELRRKLEL